MKKFVELFKDKYKSILDLDLIVKEISVKKEKALLSVSQEGTSPQNTELKGKDIKKDGEKSENIN